MADAAFLIAAIGAAVAVTGLIWQLTLYRLSVPRLQARNVSRG